MKFLIIFMIFQAISAVLLACPVTIEAQFREKLSLRVGYLFIRYRIAPRPPKKPEKPEKEKPEKHRLKQLFKETGLNGFLKILGEIAKTAAKAAGKIGSHLIFSRFWLKIDVGGKDASKTAVNYGSVCGTVSSATSLLFEYAKYKGCRIEVMPDFCSDKSYVAFEMKAHIKAFFLVNALMQALMGTAKIFKTIKTVRNG